MSGVRIRDAVRPLVWAGGAIALSRIPAANQLVPALAVLRGPFGLVLLALGAAVALARGLSGAWVRAWFRCPDPGPRTLFAVGAALYLVVGIHHVNNLRVSGDEPHYLLMSQSLWREHDLDLRDNLERGDYLEYTPGPLVPHYGAPRRDGRPFPAHSPGLPALLAPVYALGGRRGSVAFLSLLSAAAAVQVHTLALRVTADRAAALAAWAAALGPPLFFYSFHVYTEAPSALALALGLRILLASPGPAGAAAAALLASALPWLHLKMAFAALALGLVAVVRLRRGALASFLGVVGCGAAAFLGYYASVFGRPSPLAIYGGVPRDVSAAPVLAAAGMLLDRSFGLLFHAPAAVLALAGLAPLARKGWREALPHLAVGAAVLVPGLFWRMWWGGQCPPGRFLVPLAPLMGVAIAARLEGAARGLARWRWSLLGAGTTFAVFMAARPGELLLLNRGDRPTRVWAALSGEVPVARYLPSLVSGAAAEQRVAILWVVAFAAVLALDSASRRREAVDRLFRGLGLPVLALLLLGALVDAWARGSR